MKDIKRTTNSHKHLDWKYNKTKNMRTINFYEHLNKDDKVKFSIPETAKVVTELNYGTQRFLSEIVKIREASDNMQYSQFAQHTQQLRELLEAGWY